MTTLIDTIPLLLWPFIVSAVAWIIAICALAEPSELSAIVRALTRSDAPDRNYTEHPRQTRDA